MKHSIHLVIYICTWWLKKVSLSKMAGQMTSALCYFAIILHLILLISFNNGQRFGLKAKTLHIAEDYESYSYRKPLVINRNDYSDVREASASRMRRDVPLFPNNNPNITTKVRYFILIFYHRQDSFDKIHATTMPSICFPHNLRCFSSLIVARVCYSPIRCDFTILRGS